MTRPGFRNLISGLVLALALLSVDTKLASARETAVAQAATTVSRERARSNQRVFDRVWTTVRREYYDPRLQGVDWNAARATYRPRALSASDDRTLYAAINAMLDLLGDDHAGASSPASARREDGLRSRRPIVGLTLYPEGEGLYSVEQVRPGSPAEQAGIGLGWRLLTGDGRGWSPDVDVVEGQMVSLTLTDETGTPRNLTLLPRVMDPLPAFVADRSRPGVVVLKVAGFEPGLGDWMGEQLSDLPHGTDVVVDLRGNAGGLLVEAEAVLGCFLAPNRVWASRRTRSGRSTALTTGRPCGALDDPVSNEVVVLVDRTSRSAAELTPAALQEAGRAVVVGETTAGAVLISRETPLPDGGRLTLSQADFVTSGGVRLEKRGVTPDVVAARTLADRLAERDPALEVAVGLLQQSDLAAAPASGR